MTPVTLALVGPHGAGKTTLGRLLAARLGVSFEHEIGGELRRAQLAVDPARHAMRTQEAFDAAVMRRELARDAARERDAPRVVETWHPGNLAYAARRSPEVARAYHAALDAMPVAWRRGVVVQPLTLRASTARARLSEPGPDTDALLAFFREVGDEAARVARSLGLAVLPSLATDDDSPEALADQVLHRVSVFARGIELALATRRRSPTRRVSVVGEALRRTTRRVA